MIKPWTTLIGRGLTIASLIGLGSIPALADQTLLTRAQVYKLVRTVQILPSDRPARSASLSDVLVPLDALQTGGRSRAELLFNEGSLARIGANAIFRFSPGMRSFQLRNGVALIMAPPQTATTQVETPGGQVTAQASLSAPPGTPTDVPPPADLLAMAMVVQVNAETNETRVFALTNSDIRVTDLKGQFVFLKGGQTVALLNGVLGPVLDFDLRQFYQTSGLAIGLGPGQEALILQELPAVQKTLTLVRQATLAALTIQERWLEGLCTLNGRGSFSTLATNCITTNADDPLRRFQDWRDATTPPRPQVPPSIAPPPVTPPIDPQPPVTPPIDPQPPIIPDPLPPNPNNPRPNNPNANPVGVVILIQGGNRAPSSNQTPIP